MKQTKVSTTIRAALAAGAIALLAGCAATGTADRAATASATGAAPTLQSVRADMRRVADWQIANLDSRFLNNPSVQSRNPRGWLQGTFFLGLADWADMAGDPRYRATLERIATENQWRLGDRLYHADDHLIGLTYLWLRPDGTAPELRPMRASFDQILADPPRNPLAFGEGENGCQKRWCWIDALFMAPATWMKLSQVTGDDRYAAYADAEFWAVVDYLRDKDSGLFYRDSTYFPPRLGEQNEKIYWARGNGWIYGGIANILRVLPPSDPRRARYVQLFQDFSARLVRLQRADGSWNPSLVSTLPATAETSGTGLFTYGLAFGVNEGLLTGPEYAQAALKGWSLLSRNIGSDGKLGYVQQVGSGPATVKQSDTQYYGSGALLLAGAQIARMQGR